jgi:hypothetical protein
VSVADDIRNALSDAIEWQKSLADVYEENDPERVRALQKVATYRKILKRRYGDKRSSAEKIDDDLSKLPSVSIYDIQKTNQK